MDTYLGCGYSLRRGSSKALEKYEAFENEVVVNTDTWKPQVWIAPHWVTLHGVLLYRLSRVAFFCGFQRVIVFGAGELVRPLVLDSGDLELYIPDIGELVINSDTCTVHVGDGQTLGGHPAP